MPKEVITDYQHLRAWGSMMHSNSYYLKCQVEAARRDNAPQDAIYYHDGEQRWVTFAEVTDAATRKVIQNMLQGEKNKK